MSALEQVIDRATVVDVDVDLEKAPRCDLGPPHCPGLPASLGSRWMCDNCGGPHLRLLCQSCAQDLSGPLAWLRPYHIPCGRLSTMELLSMWPL